MATTDPSPTSPAAASATAADTSSPAIADPGALGLAAFAMTTFVLSCFNSGLLSLSVQAVALPLALFYGGTTQFVAGLWEFRRGNTFAATAFTSYGAFWLSFWLYITQIAPKLDPAHANQATGIYLLSWAIFTAYMTVSAMRVNGSVLAVFVALTLTFLFLAIGAFATSTGWNHVGGWVGIITAVLAWYASFAVVTNATWKKTVLPTWPRG